jgi:lipid A ethanolaminephosphotransferase
LKQNQTHQSAMLYMSDHGESLGEKGLYLHGMSYFIAPKEQTHVASYNHF